jgi:hypothetical protein
VPIFPTLIGHLTASSSHVNGKQCPIDIAIPELDGSGLQTRGMSQLSESFRRPPSSLFSGKPNDVPLHSVVALPCLHRDVEEANGERSADTTSPWTQWIPREPFGGTRSRQRWTYSATDAFRSVVSRRAGRSAKSSGRLGVRASRCGDTKSAYGMRHQLTCYSTAEGAVVDQFHVKEGKSRFHRRGRRAPCMLHFRIEYTSDAFYSSE